MNWYCPVIGRHGSWGLSHISKPVLKYSNRGQGGTTECTVVQSRCVHSPRDWNKVQMYRNKTDRSKVCALKVWEASVHFSENWAKESSSNVGRPYWGQNGLWPLRCPQRNLQFFLPNPVILLVCLSDVCRPFCVSQVVDTRQLFAVRWSTNRWLKTILEQKKIPHKLRGLGVPVCNLKSGVCGIMSRR